MGELTQSWDKKKRERERGGGGGEEKKSVLSLDWVCTSVLGMVETGERMPNAR